MKTFILCVTGSTQGA